MTHREYIVKLGGVIANFNQLLFKQVTATGQAAEVLILDVIERVRNTGKDAKGNSFSPYSDKYKKMRSKKGRETGFKNFEMTTQMWKDFQNRDKKVDDSGISITQKGTSEQFKINYQSEYEKKSIIDISKKEEEKYVDNINKAVYKILDIK